MHWRSKRTSGICQKIGSLDGKTEQNRLKVPTLPSFFSKKKKKKNTGFIEKRKKIIDFRNISKIGSLDGQTEQNRLKVLTLPPFFQKTTEFIEKRKTVINFLIEKISIYKLNVFTMKSALGNISHRREFRFENRCKFQFEKLEKRNHHNPA